MISSETRQLMGKDIVIIDGHPDPDRARFCHALAATYAESAMEAGHRVSSLKVAELDIACLRTQAEWEHGEPSATIRAAQQAIAAASHLVIIYPLWLGDLPAKLKAFFEQVFRPGYAIQSGKRTLSPGLLKGKSARIIVTMGMPALIYRWFFFAHSLKSLRRNILYFAGIWPVRESLIGNVEGSASSREKWLQRIRSLARQAR